MLYKFIDLLKKHIKDNFFIYATVVLCFLIGISVGAFTVKVVDKHQKEELFYYLRNFFEIFHNSNLNSFNILKQSFINNFQLLSLSWVLGAFIITAPLVLIIIGFKGFVIGFTIGLLIEEFKFWGALIIIFGILPQNIFIISIFTIASVISLTFATGFLKSKIHKIKTINFSKVFLLYSSRYGVLLALLLIACLIEAYIAPIFIRLIVKNVL
ncbi:stage II sporulation protein M [Natronincola peptidivorans]|uniref:Stage II sporulation protein M n=1 Tax=Natronincola peptidivorans TaxID=426128 RepID=A0A1H9YMP8_9FIRM|nr:stage II sporulation protein M [Natronincola peptidivorans]